MADRDYPKAWVEAVARALHHRIATASMSHRPVEDQDRHADDDWHGRGYSRRGEGDRELFRADARQVLAAFDAAGGLSAPIAAAHPNVNALQDELADLRERFAALAAIEEYIGESCNNASHNIKEVLTGDDPRPDADRWGLEYERRSVS
ncbi:hypothetical protein BDK92_7148 [Micromonospora pisi]|uniref:Uncharacterized protein n=1 Tax=Micromonospora pisi TaxID=589240 RepID=A0A495JWE2_9ACTN|nr:hypothetical protein [Micromonospora pisi]RKR92672.1 hypothetical protein BDK92_7148 [Micromonospora pisi]